MSDCMICGQDYEDDPGFMYTNESGDVEVCLCWMCIKAALDKWMKKERDRIWAERAAG